MRVGRVPRELGNKSKELKDGLSFLPCHSVGVQARNSPTQDEAKRLGGNGLRVHFSQYKKRWEERREKEQRVKKEA